MDLSVRYYNDVHVRVDCDRAIGQELSDYFKFEVPGSNFHPLVKNKVWDGKIRLFNINTQLIYTGLIPHLIKFANEFDYTIEVDSFFAPTAFTEEDALAFIKSLNLPSKIEIRPYQVLSFVQAVQQNRALIVSPTASGKSFLIYLLFRFFIQHITKRVLLIVPSVGLIHQIFDDFKDYGFDSDKHIHKVYAGEEKLDTTKGIILSTWQSVYKMPKKYFSQFEVVIGDEAHKFKAKSLTSIMEKLIRCPFRFGFTGTLDGTLTNKLVLEGLFGKLYISATTKQLMDQGYLAQLNLKCLVLQYSDSDRKSVKGASYPEEMDFICASKARNKFIRNLAVTQKKNTLVLFRYVEKHGKALYDDIVKHTDIPVYLIYSKIDGEVRNEVRKIVNEKDNALIIASYGTFSTAINIPNLHNIVFASPTKSVITTLQSIGRGLRKSETKSEVTLYDLADDLSRNGRKNHTLRHFEERINIYYSEEFDPKIYQVKLTDDQADQGPS